MQERRLEARVRRIGRLASSYRARRRRFTPPSRQLRGVGISTIWSAREHRRVVIEDTRATAEPRTLRNDGLVTTSRSASVVGLPRSGVLNGASRWTEQVRQYPDLRRRRPPVERLRRWRVAWE